MDSVAGSDSEQENLEGGTAVKFGLCFSQEGEESLVLDGEREGPLGGGPTAFPAARTPGVSLHPASSLPPSGAAAALVSTYVALEEEEWGAGSGDDDEEGGGAPRPLPAIVVRKNIAPPSVLPKKELPDFEFPEELARPRFIPPPTSSKVKSGGGGKKGKSAAAAAAKAAAATPKAVVVVEEEEPEEPEEEDGKASVASSDSSYSSHHSQSSEDAESLVEGGEGEEAEEDDSAFVRKGLKKKRKGGSSKKRSKVHSGGAAPGVVSRKRGSGGGEGGAKKPRAPAAPKGKRKSGGDSSGDELTATRSRQEEVGYLENFSPPPHSCVDALDTTSLPFIQASMGKRSGEGGDNLFHVVPMEIGSAGGGGGDGGGEEGVAATQQGGEGVAAAAAAVAVAEEEGGEEEGLYWARLLKGEGSDIYNLRFFSLQLIARRGRKQWFLYQRWGQASGAGVKAGDDTLSQGHLCTPFYDFDAAVEAFQETLHFKTGIPTEETPRLYFTKSSRGGSKGRGDYYFDPHPLGQGPARRAYRMYPSVAELLESETSELLLKAVSMKVEEEEEEEEGVGEEGSGSRRKGKRKSGGDRGAGGGRRGGGGDAAESQEAERKRRKREKLREEVEEVEETFEDSPQKPPRSPSPLPPPPTPPSLLPTLTLPSLSSHSLLSATCDPAPLLACAKALRLTPEETFPLGKVPEEAWERAGKGVRGCWDGVWGGGEDGEEDDGKVSKGSARFWGALGCDYAPPHTPTLSSSTTLKGAVDTLFTASHLDASARVLRKAVKTVSKKGGSGGGSGKGGEEEGLEGGGRCEQALFSALAASPSDLTLVGPEEGEYKALAPLASFSSTTPTTPTTALSILRISREEDTLAFPFTASQLGGSKLLWWAGSPMHPLSLLAHGLFPPSFEAAMAHIPFGAAVPEASKGSRGEVCSPPPLIFSSTPAAAIACAQALGLCSTTTSSSSGGGGDFVWLTLCEVACGKEEEVGGNGSGSGSGMQVTPRPLTLGSHSVKFMGGIGGGDEEGGSLGKTKGTWKEWEWKCQGEGGEEGGEATPTPLYFVEGAEGGEEVERHSWLIPDKEQVRVRYVVRVAV